MINSKQKIFEELSEKYYKLNEKKAQTKIAKKNNITLDKLKYVISTALDDLAEYEGDYNTFSDEKYKQKLEWYMRRATYYYVNEPLTYSVTRSFDNIALPYEDRLAAARLGFLEALNTFDEGRKVQFSTYAWRLMSNQIIAHNKKRTKSKVIKQQEREIKATDNGVIFKIELAKNYRKVLHKSKPVDLYNITVYERDFTYEHTYEYLFNLPATIKEGSTIHPGDILGTIAGAETEISSMDWMVDNDEHGDVRFNNPLTQGDEHLQYDHVKQHDIIDILNEAIKTLSKQEQIIITKRFLEKKKTNRATLAKEMQMTDYAISKTESNALKKLKIELVNYGYDSNDLEVFS